MITFTEEILNVHYLLKVNEPDDKFQVEHRTFHMNIVDTNKFEEKLREAEARIGVGPGGGVPVIYERGSDTAGKLLVSLIVAGILLSLFSRARTMKTPLSMDTFVRIIYQLKRLNVYVYIITTLF